MRDTLDAAALASQKALSPEYDIVVNIQKAINAFSAQYGEMWTEIDATPPGLSGWNTADIVSDAAQFGNYLLRVFQSNNDGAIVSQLVDVAADANFTLTSVNTVASFTASAVATAKPAIAVYDTTAYLYYALPDGNIYLRTSTNGTTWSAASTVYSGGNQAGALHAYHTSTLHRVAFSISSSGIQLRVASKLAAGSWNVSGNIGTSLYPIGQDASFIYAQRDLSGTNEHSIGVVQVAFSSGTGALTFNGSFELQWNLTGANAIYWTNIVARGLFGRNYLSVNESSPTNRYLAAGKWESGYTPSEPEIITDTQITDVDKHFTPAQIGDTYAYLCAYSKVYKSLLGNAIVEITAPEIISYRYDQEQGQGGSLTIVTHPNAVLSQIQAGAYLWIKRTVAKAGVNSGEDTLAFRIYRTQRHRDKFIITAYDALGIMGQFRPRRPLSLRPSDHTYGSALGALISFAGIAPDSPSGLTNDPVPTFTWHPAENGLSAMYRLMKTQQFVAVSTSEPGYNQPLILVQTPSSDVTYRYGTGQHPIIEQVTIEDYRDPSIIVIHGAVDRLDPTQGETWEIRRIRGNALPYRPNNPIYYLNRNINQDTQIEIADAQQFRYNLKRQAGWIDVQANLVQEPYDVIDVGGENFYVSRITERFERGRLTQRIYLSAA